MDLKEVLRRLGLTEGEALVYLALLRNGESKAGEIKKDTKLHRTTIYDFLDSLIKQGLVGYVVKNNVKFYRAAHPSKLFNLIQEKQELLEESMDQMAKLAESEKKTLKVDIYEGVEGFKTLLNRLLRGRKEFLAFGVDESLFEERFPYIIRNFLEKEQKLGLEERIITKKGVKFVYKYPHMHYKYIDEKFFSPTPTVTFVDNVGFIIWDPLTIIIIENKDLAESHRKYFEFVWSIADDRP